MLLGEFVIFFSFEMYSKLTSFWNDIAPVANPSLFDVVRGLMEKLYSVRLIVWSQRMKVAARMKWMSPI